MRIQARGLPSDRIPASFGERFLRVRFLRVRRIAGKTPAGDGAAHLFNSESGENRQRGRRGRQSARARVGLKSASGPQARLRKESVLNHFG